MESYQTKLMKKKSLALNLLTFDILWRNSDALMFSGDFMKPLTVLFGH